MINTQTSHVKGPMVWYGKQFASDSSWICELTEIDIGELENALYLVKKYSPNHIGFGSDCFPIPKLRKKLNNILKNVEFGRGFAVLRGMPIGRFTRQDIESIYWGIGTYIGMPISQNSDGQLITEVSDKGSSYSNNINDRGYMSGDKLRPHVDTSDITVLLCIEQSTVGGISSLASSAAIFNEILDQNPEFFPSYFKGFYHDLRGEGPTGELDEVTQNRIPVFSFYNGFFSCCYNEKIIRSAHDKINQPLDELESKAIDKILEIAESNTFRFDFELRQGDIQFINNYTLLHFRSAFSGLNINGLARCLLRMWVNSINPRPLAPKFSNRYNTGPRGGIFRRDKL